MERYGYRDKARIISIVDMVWSTINLGNTFLGFLALSAYYSYWNSVDQDLRSSPSVGIGVVQSASTSGSPVMSPSGNGEMVFSPRAFRKLAWMMVMAQFAIHFSQLTFAINLYTGTAKNATAKAPAACRLWFITSSLLLGILGLRLFFQVREANGIFCMSEIIFRAVGMYLVGEYAKEVKNTMIYPPPPPVYFSSHPDQIHQHSLSQPHSRSHRHHHHQSPANQNNAHHLNMLPFFSPPYPELPPKYEEVIRQSQNQTYPGVVITTNANTNTVTNTNPTISSDSTGSGSSPPADVVNTAESLDSNADTATNSNSTTDEAHSTNYSNLNVDSSSNLNSSSNSNTLPPV